MFNKRLKLYLLSKEKSMKIKILVVVITIILAILGVGVLIMVNASNNKNNSETIKLNAPKLDSKTSIEQAIKKRRSTREYKDTPLTIQEVSQLLWAAQGITDAEDLRSAPSAGALYPLEIYLVAGKINGLPAAIYKYNPEKHLIKKIIEGDKREELCKVALEQECIDKAPASIIICANYKRTTKKYGDRGEKYAQMEVGAVAENIYLQATSLNLGTVFVGAFDDNGVKKVIDAPKNEEPLCIMPIGKK